MTERLGSLNDLVHAQRDWNAAYGQLAARPPHGTTAQTTVLRSHLTRLSVRIATHPYWAMRAGRAPVAWMALSEVAPDCVLAGRRGPHERVRLPHGPAGVDRPGHQGHGGSARVSADDPGDWFPVKSLCSQWCRCHMTQLHGWVVCDIPWVLLSAAESLAPVAKGFFLLRMLCKPVT